MADSPGTQRLQDLTEKVKSGDRRPCQGAVKAGVDPATANRALIVLNGEDNLLAGISQPSRAVKDGARVDFLTASRVVSGLKEMLEERLNRTLTHPETAIPPGILPSKLKVSINMVEAAGFEVTEIVDAPVAAARALNIRDGTVVDVGSGTTGISILRESDIIFSADEPTGGNPMTRVRAGALGISFAKAEEMKKAPGHAEQVFALVCPVAEKMAHLVAGWLAEVIYLVDGASSLHQFAGACT